jgi:hypothetical protein
MKILFNVFSLIIYSLANELKSEDAATLGALIEEHHFLFLAIYGPAAVTPKWHYMVHLPDQILK